MAYVWSVSFMTQTSTKSSEPRSTEYNREKENEVILKLITKQMIEDKDHHGVGIAERPNPVRYQQQPHYATTGMGLLRLVTY